MTLRRHYNGRVSSDDNHHNGHPSSTQTSSPEKRKRGRLLHVQATLYRWYTDTHRLLVRYTCSPSTLNMCLQYGVYVYSVYICFLSYFPCNIHTELHRLHRKVFCIYILIPHHHHIVIKKTLKCCVNCMIALCVFSPTVWRGVNLTFKKALETVVQFRVLKIMIKEWK